MKLNFIYGLTMTTVLLLSSCDTETIKVSDTVSIQEYSFSDYNRIAISNDFDAFVQFSENEERIEIEANGNIQDKIEVSKSENTLSIKLENKVNLRGNVTLKVYITTSNISWFKASGDSSILLEDVLVSDKVTIDLSGDSTFHGELEAQQLTVDLSGDSDADLYGKANSLIADLEGDSKLKDYDLTIEDVNIELSGDSEAFLTVNNTIAVEASGDSELSYRGEATIIRQELSGGSKVRKTD